MRLPDEFRVNHRAASECLLHAVTVEARPEDIYAELDKAVYFEDQALKAVHTPRQRALAIGLLHTIDLIRAVTEAEFKPR